jgi:GTP-binding protein Era
MGERMVGTALRTLGETDAVVFMMDASQGIRAEDEDVARRLAGADTTTVVALNKIDRVRKETLLPLIERTAALLPGREIVPVSALTGENLPDLLETIVSCLPEGPALFGADEVTEQTERFLAQEIIREKLLMYTREEIPYESAVIVEGFEEKPEKELLIIRATICVERPSQKAIVIGEGGARVREIGRAARLELEAFFGAKVYLELFVKVKRGWSKNAKMLGELGI